MSWRCEQCGEMVIYLCYELKIHRVFLCMFQIRIAICVEGGEESKPNAHAALLQFASAAEEEMTLSDELEGIIRNLAETGAAACYPWDALRILLVRSSAKGWPIFADIEHTGNDSCWHMAIQLHAATVRVAAVVLLDVEVGQKSHCSHFEAEGPELPSR
eukprot:s1916_g5.t1